MHTFSGVLKAGLFLLHYCLFAEEEKGAVKGQDGRGNGEKLAETAASWLLVSWPCRGHTPFLFTWTPNKDLRCGHHRTSERSGLVLWKKDSILYVVSSPLTRQFHAGLLITSRVMVTVMV